eukprot:14189461-Heterocapsa_arctica.AAC.1
MERRTRARSGKGHHEGTREEEQDHEEEDCGRHMRLQTLAMNDNKKEKSSGTKEQDEQQGLDEQGEVPVQDRQ